MERLTSRNNPHIKELSSLKKGDPSLFLVEGHHLVEMASASGSLLEVLSVEPYPGKEKSLLVSYEIIEKLSASKTPEGIIGACRKIEKEIAKDGPVLLLDRVQDPGNVGTLLRSALAFGFSEVYSIEGTASFYGSKAIASSQGAIFSLALKEGLKEEEAVALLKSQGFRLIGSALENAEDFRTLSLPDDKYCLILGNEGQGMSPSLLGKTDVNAYIPISGIDSLNVGVAGGILMERLQELAGKVI